jgi:hypothetical protein
LKVLALVAALRVLFLTPMAYSADDLKNSIEAKQQLA